MDCYGTAIIDAAVAQKGCRVIYKPHPRIIDSKDPRITAAHKYIMNKLSRGPHEVHLTGDVLSILKDSDLLISDISSVTLDYLYLRPSGAIFVSDRRNNRKELEAESPVARAAYVIDASTISQLNNSLAKVLAHDELFDRRQEVCRYYFGGIAAGESTAAFYRELERSVAEHDAAVSRLSRIRRSN
jgi:CDP-glycerol glycerophosphotransferase (TagB/SpsB family)